MHPVIFREFESVIARKSRPRSVLEVGAVPSQDTLLCLPSLRAVRERVGVDLGGPCEFDGFRIVRGNANKLEFESGRFDLVVSNATLEHDPFFWRSLDEMRRVLSPNGWLVIGVPGYGRSQVEDACKATLGALIHRLPGSRRLEAKLDPLLRPTATFEIHNRPGDYYRFSEQAVHEVFFAGMNDVSVNSVMFPPRIIGSARKPNGVGA